MIFAVVNTKGGVGKTTTAVHLAGMFARTHSTLLIDADPQHSSAGWAAFRRDAKRGPSPVTVCLSGDAIYSEGRMLATDRQRTVIDTGARDGIGLRSALALAHHAIVPIGASQLDSMALSGLLEAVDLARSYNPNLKLRVLLTRIDRRTRETDDMLAYLQQKKLDVLATRVHERVAYRRTIPSGAIVQELGKDHAAAAEMDALLAEVSS
jgi:chromosome partitioning protein